MSHWKTAPFLVVVFISFFTVYLFLRGGDGPRGPHPVLPKFEVLEPITGDAVGTEQRKRPRKEQAELCFVSVWEGKKLPPYIRTHFDSLATYPPKKVKLLFFHDGVDHSKVPAYPGLEFVDIRDARERSFFTWDTFLHNRLCLASNFDTEKACNKAFRGLNTAEDFFPAIQELRPLYPIIFHDWIKPSKCKAWAWGDSDMFFGDLPSLLEPYIKPESDTHVLSIHHENESVYLGGQFTIHFQHTPEAIEMTRELYKGCKHFQTIESLATALRNGATLDELDSEEENLDEDKEPEVKSSFDFADEGCYSKGVFESKAKVRVLHSQGLQLDGYKYAQRTKDGQLWVARQCEVEEKVGDGEEVKTVINYDGCRKLVAEAAAREKLSMKDAKTKNVNPTNEWYDHDDDMDWHIVAENLPVTRTEDQDCSGWLPEEMRLCMPLDYYGPKLVDGFTTMLVKESSGKMSMKFRRNESFYELKTNKTSVESPDESRRPSALRVLSYHYQDEKEEDDFDVHIHWPEDAIGGSAIELADGLKVLP